MHKPMKTLGRVGSLFAFFCVLTLCVCADNPEQGSKALVQINLAKNFPNENESESFD